MIQESETSSKPNIELIPEAEVISKQYPEPEPEVQDGRPEPTPLVTDKPNFLGIPLQEKSEDEKRLIRFKEFLNTRWGLPAVVVQFRALFAGGYPPIPVPTRWKIPSSLDVASLVWEQVQTENFIDEIWPSIVIMMGDDITNFEWAARIASVLSLFNIIKILPIVLEDSK